MPDAENKNDSAWNSLFAKHDIARRIEEDGCYVITADQIREFREPRLMAKFDHESNLPALFRKHGLSILPVSRGKYVISRFQCYMPLAAEPGTITHRKLPETIQSIDPGDITSEAVCINCALAAGIFADFLGEKQLTPTVSGRMGSGKFSFMIGGDGRDVEVRVDNAQIEIDAALEGSHRLFLVEAKRDLSSDFIIRQLFYPFKTWEHRTAKQVVPIYLVHSNGIFHLYEFRVADSRHYNSLRLVKSRRYAIEDTHIELGDVLEVARSTVSVPEPEIPFPQADRFERIVNLCELLRDGELSRDDVTKTYDFDSRQTNYYTDAGRYLGLLSRSADPGERKYALTDEAREILSLPYRERQLSFCRCILRHGIFRDIFLRSMSAGCLPDKPEIVRHMRAAGLYRINRDSTYLRRSSTIVGWIGWIADLWSAPRPL